MTPAASPSSAFLERIPFDFARQHLVVSAGMSKDGCEKLLVSESADPAVLHNVGVRLGSDIQTEVADAESIARIVESEYADARSDSGENTADHTDKSHGEGHIEDVESALSLADRDLLSTSGKAPVVRLVDAILFEALGLKASDVHVQPLETVGLVRYRVDGVLHTAREVPIRLVGPVVSRIKVMGGMDIAERRLAQDGRTSVSIGRGDAARTIDLRISTLPTSFGERAVVRLLDNDTGRSLTDFGALGMPDDVRASFLGFAGRANGIVLVTGPTGSGKTTTLYTTLKWLAGRGVRTKGGDLNIMTIEDPVEYELSGGGLAISQAQVNNTKGVTFATGLRHILRQDPDVIMIGEIRDAETARIAIQASLTGHLVFSTLHTNDASTAVTRLLDLGVEPYLVSASLSCVLAQRLVRRVHGACEGKGCDACLHSGYRGRIGIFELLSIDERIRALLSRGADASDVRSAGIDTGMQTLRQQGDRLIADGLTTRLEIDRTTIDVGMEHAR